MTDIKGEDMRIPVWEHYAKAPFRHRRDLETVEEIICQKHTQMVAAMETYLSDTVRIDDSWTTSQTLRSLYFSTRPGIENNFSLLMEAAMRRQLEQERLSVGWEES